MSKKLELSVVVPVFNEEAVLPEFIKRLKKVLSSSKKTYEVIFVDDGSRDQSVSKINEAKWSQASVISFVSNAGHMAALDAGYRAATGNYVISLDSDLQHPPELIPVLLETAQSQNVDVVYAARSSRVEDSWLKRNSALMYYSLARKLSGIPVDDSAADFRLISQSVVEIIRSLPPGTLVFRLLIPSLGFPSAVVNYKASERHAGESKYTLTRMTKLSVESLVGFSTRPLTIAVQLGIFSTIASILGFIYAIVAHFSGQAETGWASLISTILLLFGLLFVILGVHGLYIGAILKNTMHRPTYIIKKDQKN